MRLQERCLFAEFAHLGIESSFFIGNWPLMGGGSLVDQRRMTQSIICHRAFEFAVRTVKLCEKVTARGFGAHHIAHQLIRCGTSIGANAEEAQEGQSKADYIAKMCVSSKEARETAYWLRLAIAVSCVKCGEVEWELKEANEPTDRGRD